MNWIRNNRFLSGYLAVLIVGIGVLGYLLYASYGRYSQVSDDYHTQVTELKRLQNLSPYPDAQNLKRYSEVKQRYSAAVADLQRQLAALEPAAETPPPTPLQFQDRLRRVVDDVTKSAQEAGVALPENFYLGFEQYRGAPPDTAVTPALSAELNAIRDLVDILIKDRISALTAVKRTLLPREGGSNALAEIARPGRPNLAAPTAGGANDLVTRESVDVEFTSLPSAFREALNAITGAPRLYVITTLRVKNEVDKGPPRGGEQSVGAASPLMHIAPPPPPRSGPPGAEGAPEQNGVPVEPLPEKGPPPLRYVVGLEKVSVVARIDLVKVAPPR